MTTGPPDEIQNEDFTNANPRYILKGKRSKNKWIEGQKKIIIH